MNGIANHSRPTTRVTTKARLAFLRNAYTDTSLQALSLPDAVLYASTRDGVLQSAGEAVVFRCLAQGTRYEAEANAYQVTRTAAIYFERDGKYYVAFDDDRNPTHNILLSRAQGGYDAHNLRDRWLVKKDDPIIKAMLATAKRHERIVEVSKSPLSFSTIAYNGISAYGMSNVIRATLHGARCLVKATLIRPQTDPAERYARFLHDHHYAKGFEYLLPLAAFPHLGVDENTVEVRRVGLGGLGDCLYNLYATDHCDVGGCARGVRKASKTNSARRGVASKLAR
jgi:hypothetical protein